MKKRHLILAAAATMLAACNNEGSVPAADAIADTPVLVRAGVDGLVSRAGMTTADLSTLGLSIQNPANPKYCYTNVQYVKDTDGTSFHTATGVATPLWENATQAVTVTAYAPYNASWSGTEVTFAVQTDQSTAEAVKVSDLLWVQEEVNPGAETQTGNITYQERALNIKLQHKLSKLIVNLRYNDEVQEETTVESLTVQGLSTQCVIRTADGTFSRQDTPSDIIACPKTAESSDNASFEVIFPPQTCAFKVAALLSDQRDFVYYSSAFEFQSHKVYTLNLAVGKDKVQIADDGITAKDWDTVAGGTLETDDKSPDNN